MKPGKEGSESGTYCYGYTSHGLGHWAAVSLKGPETLVSVSICLSDPG